MYTDQHFTHTIQFKRNPNIAFQPGEVAEAIDDVVHGLARGHIIRVVQPTQPGGPIHVVKFEHVLARAFALDLSLPSLTLDEEDDDGVIHMPKTHALRTKPDDDTTMLFIVWFGQTSLLKELVMQVFSDLRTEHRKLYDQRTAREMYHGPPLYLIGGSVLTGNIELPSDIPFRRNYGTPPLVFDA